MWPHTLAQRNALMGSHPMDLRISVIRGTQYLGDIGISSGAVSATYSTQGGRDGSLVVDRNVIDGGLLNPLSDEVYIRTGIAGVIEVPIFTGRVDGHGKT